MAFSTDAPVLRERNGCGLFPRGRNVSQQREFFPQALAVFSLAGHRAELLHSAPDNRAGRQQLDLAAVDLNGNQPMLRVRQKIVEIAEARMGDPGSLQEGKCLVSVYRHFAFLELNPSRPQYRFTPRAGPAPSLPA